MWSNGFQIAGGGTSFPQNPTPNDLFYRTDLRTLYVYTGTAWSPVSDQDEAMPAFYAYQSANYDPGPGVWGFPGMTEGYDLCGNGFYAAAGTTSSGAASKYTVPEDGYYEFDGRLGHQGRQATQSVTFQLWKNGAGWFTIDQRFYDSTATGYVEYRMWKVPPIFLQANDYIQFACYENGSVTYRTVLGCIFAGRKARR